MYDSNTENAFSNIKNLYVKINICWSITLIFLIIRITACFVIFKLLIKKKITAQGKKDSMLFSCILMILKK